MEPTQAEMIPVANAIKESFRQHQRLSMPATEFWLAIARDALVKLEAVRELSFKEREDAKGNESQSEKE